MSRLPPMPEVAPPSGEAKATTPGDLVAKLTAEHITFRYGDQVALKDITVPLYLHKVTAFIGPSGCGKSTLLRIFNRMYELYPEQRVEGRVMLDGQDILSHAVDPAALRARVGMLFQKPTPFPMSIFDNVALGLKLHMELSQSELQGRVEAALRQAALWDEVKDILGQSGLSLSGGQQQRLCLARTIAVEPEVILLDEPCSALDPLSTARIEETIDHLKARFTIAIVTHNMQQAARISDFTAFLYLGELVEHGPSDRLFTTPADPRTRNYITGRFG